MLLAARLGRTALFVLSAVYITLSNSTVLLNVDFGPFTLSVAVVIYSVVYLIADIVTEYYGKRDGYRLAASNLGIQVLFWVYLYLSLTLTPTGAPGEPAHAVKQSLVSLYGTSAQITIAALVASVGPFLDVYVFSAVRRATQKSIAPAGEERSIGKVLLRNKLSTLAVHASDVLER